MPKVTSVSREFTFCCDLWPLKSFELVHVNVSGDIGGGGAVCVLEDMSTTDSLERALEMRFE